MDTDSVGSHCYYSESDVELISSASECKILCHSSPDDDHYSYGRTNKLIGEAKLVGPDHWEMKHWESVPGGTYTTLFLSPYSTDDG